jgi:AAA family ATP:ADP antiporter
VAEALSVGREERSGLERLLAPFADVRAGEAGTALLSLLSLFLLMVGYYVAKTVREPLILATGGAEMKSYAAAAQAVALMGFIPLYGWLASRAERMRLIVVVILFFVACLELFYVGGRLRVPNLGFVFYVWVGIFSLATVAQFWSFANDIYSREAGERLFALIGVGMTGGSWAGAKLAEELFRHRVSPFLMLQLTVLLLLLHLGLYVVVNRRARGRAGREAAQPALAGPGGFALVFGSSYLRLIGALLILLNVVNTTGEYIIGRSVVMAADAARLADAGLDREAFIGSFYGNYFFWVNLTAVVLQAFLASRLVRLFGMGGVLLALPLVSLSAYGLVGAGVAFSVVRWAKTAENATDYSIMNTARQMLWLPTTREEKYKAKQTLDTFFVRTGDVLSAGIVFAGTQWLAFSISGFAWTNVALGLVWLLLAVLLLRRYARLAAESA